MTAENRQRGVSKAEWLEAGLEFLRDRSISDFTIEGLAKSIGIARAGFYWHFENRDELLYALLDFWIHETTEVVTENAEVLALEPKLRLLKTAEMIIRYDLVRYEIAIRQWALQDAKVARAVKRVNRTRLDFARRAFSELGFTNDELEMRTMLFVCYHTWEGPMFREISRKRRRELIASRIELLTRK